MRNRLSVCPHLWSVSYFINISFILSCIHAHYYECVNQVVLIHSAVQTLHNQPHNIFCYFISIMTFGAKIISVDILNCPNNDKIVFTQTGKCGHYCKALIYKVALVILKSLVLEIYLSALKVGRGGHTLNMSNAFNFMHQSVH